MNKVVRILLVIMLPIAVFALSSFGMYEYNNYKMFNNLVSQGNQYMIQKNYDKAIQVFQQALSYRKNTDVQNSLVVAQNLKNESSNKEIISKNIQLSTEAAKNNKYDEANKYLDEVLKVDPNNSEAKNLKDSYTKVIQEKQEKERAQEQVKVNNQQQQNTNKTRSNSSTSTRVGMTSEKALNILQNAYPEYTYVSGGEMNAYPWQPYEGQPAYRFLFRKNNDKSMYVGFVLMDGKYALRFASGM